VAGERSLQGARILLVEDNEINQEVGLAMLHEVGCAVDVAGNGQIAVELVQARPYDIVLMDMQMPVMDGITAATHIRAIARLDHVPIIAMTANVMSQDRARCAAAGMCDFVGKPIAPQELWRTLRKWYQAAGRPAALTAPLQAVQQAAPTPRLRLDIEGLDDTQGLARMLGNQALYLSLLAKFAHGQAQVVQEIEQALAQNDWETAERLAHTLKGVAGNIGATLIQEQAAVLEQGLQSHMPAGQLQGLMHTLAPQLQRLVTALSAYAAAHTESAAASTAHWPGLQRQLQQLMAQADPDAAELALQHRALIAQQLGPEQAETLLRHIANYAFEEALALLA
jgi:two-component system sensor histidine kinase/response regulator